jgi:hypothetical protein
MTESQKNSSEWIKVLIMDRPKNIPEQEQWLWENPEVLDSLRQGIEQSVSGEIYDLGSFALYADLEIND